MTSKSLLSSMGTSRGDLKFLKMRLVVLSTTLPLMKSLTGIKGDGSGGRSLPPKKLKIMGV